MSSFRDCHHRTVESETPLQMESISTGHSDSLVQNQVQLDHITQGHVQLGPKHPHFPDFLGTLV